MSLFAVIDVETTGLSPAQGDRVVEIAVVVLDEQFRVVRLFDSLVHPQRSIPLQVTQIHGISNRDIQQAPTFADLLPDLMSCLEGSTHIVAHNISFDLQFLRAELHICGLPMPQLFGRLCTMQMARKKRVARNARLSTVASALQIPSIAEAHRAIVDAGVTARVLSLLHDQRESSRQSPIQWPNHEASSARGRLYPRNSAEIALQFLTYCGLTIASKAFIARTDNGELAAISLDRVVEIPDADVLPAMLRSAKSVDQSSQILSVSEPPPLLSAGPIQCTTFMHPQVCEYRTQQQKCELLCSEQFQPLQTFLHEMHLTCPDSAFLSGPRASKMRYAMAVDLTHVNNHVRSSDAAAGLEQYASRYRSVHARVQCYMLDNDSTTVAIEVPVWINAAESRSLPFAPPDGEFLSGHIDAVSIEDKKIVIWDYKPRAAAEKFATVQVALYAYMLSVRTGLPLDFFHCGYFDSSDCFQFVPALDTLANMQEVKRPTPSRPPLTAEQRAPQKPPDLQRLGIARPHGSMNDTSTWTWHLFAQRNLSVSVIAIQRCMTESTVYTHLEQALRVGIINIQRLADAVNVQRIASVWNALPDEERNLTNLSTALNFEFPFGLLKCVTTSLEIAGQDHVECKTE